MADAHRNLAVSTVATAPSPASSGTSLVVTAAHGTRFPTPPFNATIWPTAAQPDPDNAEIVRVTAISTDTLTITRAQESTTARTVVAGDQIAAGITAKTLTDAEEGPTNFAHSVGSYYSNDVPVAASSGQSLVNDTLYLHEFDVGSVATSFDRIAVRTSAAGTAGSVVRLGIYASGPDGRPLTLLVDAGTYDGTAFANSTAALTISASLSGLVWLGIVGQGAPATAPSVWGYSGVSVSSRRVALGGNPTTLDFARAYTVATVTGALPASLTGQIPTNLARRMYLRAV